MSGLKSRIAKLAHAHPELRAALVPLIREADADNGLPEGIYLRIPSHRAVAKVKALVPGVQPFVSVRDEAIYVVTPAEYQKILGANIKGVSKGRPKPGASYRKPMQSTPYRAAADSLFMYLKKTHQWLREYHDEFDDLRLYPDREKEAQEELSKRLVEMERVGRSIGEEDEEVKEQFEQMRDHLLEVEYLLPSVGDHPFSRPTARYPLKDGLDILENLLDLTR